MLTNAQKSLIECVKDTSKSAVDLSELHARKQSINLSFRDDNGETLLHHAVRLEPSSSEKIGYLLTHQCSPNIANKQGITPLHLAFILNKTSAITELLKEDKNILAPSASGANCLHTHATKDQDLSRLYDQYRGALLPGLYQANESGRTPLHCAIEYGQRWFFDYWLPKLDFNNTCFMVGVGGESILHTVIRSASKNDSYYFLVKLIGVLPAVVFEQKKGLLGKTALDLANNLGWSKDVLFLLEHHLSVASHIKSVTIACNNNENLEAAMGTLVTDVKTALTTNSQQFQTMAANNFAEMKALADNQHRALADLLAQQNQLLQTQLITQQKQLSEIIEQNKTLQHTFSAQLKLIDQLKIQVEQQLNENTANEKERKAEKKQHADEINVLKQELTEIKNLQSASVERADALLELLMNHHNAVSNKPIEKPEVKAVTLANQSATAQRLGKWLNQGKNAFAAVARRTTDNNHVPPVTVSPNNDVAANTNGHS